MTHKENNSIKTDLWLNPRLSWHLIVFPVNPQTDDFKSHNGGKKNQLQHRTNGPDFQIVIFVSKMKCKKKTSTSPTITENYSNLVNAWEDIDNLCNNFEESFTALNLIFLFDVFISNLRSFYRVNLYGVNECISMSKVFVLILHDQEWMTINKQVDQIMQVERRRGFGWILNRNQ